MAAPAWASPMAAEVERVSRHSERRHPAREALVATPVLAEAVHDREGDRRSGDRPAPVREPGSVGRANEVLALGETLSGQGDRSLARS